MMTTGLVDADELDMLRCQYWKAGSDEGGGRDDQVSRCIDVWKAASYIGA